MASRTLGPLEATDCRYDLNVNFLAPGSCPRHLIQRGKPNPKAIYNHCRPTISQSRQTAENRGGWHPNVTAGALVANIGGHA